MRVHQVNRQNALGMGPKHWRETAEVGHGSETTIEIPRERRARFQSFAARCCHQISTRSPNETGVIALPLHVTGVHVTFGRVS